MSAPVVIRQGTGTVQAMDASVEQPDGTWYREVDRQCWTRTEPTLVQAFDHLADASGFARGLRTQGVPPLPLRPAPPASTPAPRGSCDTAYPTVCIPPPPPVLHCPGIPHQDFRVLPPDPHRLDGNKDGIGCESER